jgi:fatty-acyl-CoA synthase
MPTTPDISVSGWFKQRALRSPERTAVTFEDDAWTYAQLDKRVDDLAGTLRAGGVVRGDRVGYLGVNDSAFLVAMFAASRLGAIFVPLNFRLAGPEIEYIVNDAEIHTLLIGEEHRELALGIRAKLCCDRLLFPDSPLEGEPHSGAGIALPEDVALIMYTSGTTGRPKGAMLTNGNLWWNNVNSLLTTDFLRDDVSLNSAPLFHIGGLNVTTLVTLMKGAHLVLHKQFDAGAFLTDVVRFRVTTHFAVPAMLLFVSQHPRFEEADLSSIRQIMVGGAPMPESLLRLYVERGINVLQGYGLTETAPMVSFLTPDWALQKLGSAGKPSALTDVRLRTADGGVAAKPGERGEVCVRGPNVMAGYWQQPDATAAVMDGEWLRTGDVGYFDEDDFLYICDRVKDMLISGGENVYPAEVENVLYRHPSIAEVAVIGMPDDRWGEAVMAVAALKPGTSLSLDDLQTFVEPLLARYKIPRRLEIVDALPRNSTGKVLKFNLRATFAREPVSVLNPLSKRII